MLAAKEEGLGYLDEGTDQRELSEKHIVRRWVAAVEACLPERIGPHNREDDVSPKDIGYDLPQACMDGSIGPRGE